MPKGFGKIEHKVYKKMPAPIKRFWDSYHTTVKQLLIGAIIAAIAVVGLEARHAATTADKANREIKIFKQNSPCTPKENGEAERPNQCRESFGKGVQTLTPLQSCHVLRKGATIILIGGKPIPPVTCIVPNQEQREGEKRGSQKGAESTNTTSEGSSGTGNGSVDQGGSNHGSKSPSHDGSSGNGPKGGSPNPTSPVGSPGGNGGSEGESGGEGGGSSGGGSGGSSGEESAGSSGAGKGGIAVEVLPEVELPVKPEVCVENVLNVNCNK